MRVRWRACSFCSVVLACAALFAGSVKADSLNTLFNTGVDNAGNAIGDGAIDPHYQLVTSPDGSFPGPAAYATSPIPSPPWIANNAGSRWITPRPDGSGVVVPGQYVYEFQFDLPGLLPDTASITGGFATDDGGSIRLNGVNQGVASGGFGGLTSFTLSSDFVPGTNTLEFVVDNGAGAANPSGLRVDNLAGTATAASVNFSTAYNQGSAQTIGAGALDDDWTITSAPAGVTLGAAKSIAKHPAWFGADPNARWISAQEAVDGTSDLPAGQYTYEYDFNISRTGKLFSIDGNFLADNGVDEIRLNGVTMLSNMGTFLTPTTLPTFDDETLFLDGANTLEVVVSNGGASANPHGFQMTAWLEESISTAPTADGNGPYNLNWTAGDDLDLDASGSFDVDSGSGDSIVFYEWDINNDGTFDFSSTNPFLSLTQAQYAPFLTGGAGTFAMDLRVSDATGLTGTSQSQLIVVPEPSAWVLALVGVVSVLIFGRRRT